MGPTVASQPGPVLTVIDDPSTIVTLIWAQNDMQAPPGLPNCSPCAVELHQMSK